MVKINLDKFSFSEIFLILSLGFLNYLVLLFYSYLIPKAAHLSSSSLFFVVIMVNFFCRLIVNKFGAATLSMLTFSIFALILPNPIFGVFSIHSQIFFGLISASLACLTIDILASKNGSLGIKFERFTARELILLIVFGYLNFIILLPYNYFISSTALTVVPIPIVFTVALINVLGRLIVDKFWSITICMMVFSLLSFSLGKPNPVFGNLSGLPQIFCAFIVGLISDTAVSMVRLINLSNIFRPKKYGYVEINYSLVGNYIFYGMTYGFVAQGMVLLLTERRLIDPQRFLSLTGLISIVVFGGVIGALVYDRIKDSRLLSSFRLIPEEIWRQEFDEWHTCCDIDDIDQDGQNEILVGSGSGDYPFRCLKQGQEIWKIHLPNTPSITCEVKDINKDGLKEIIVGCYDGYLRCLRSNGEEAWKVKMNGWVWCCAIGDINKDGCDEIAAGSFDGFLYVFNHQGVKLWEVEFDSWIGCCGIGDIDNDGVNEIVAGSYDRTFRWFKDKGVEMWRALFGDWVRYCAIGDIDNDGIKEVIAGSTDGTLRCYKKNREIWRVMLYVPVQCCSIGDIDNDGILEVIVACGDNTFRCYKNGREAWVMNPQAFYSCCAIGDVDNDGANEIIAGDWDGYLHCLKIR